MIGKVILDDKTVRTRKCWWVFACKHPNTVKFSGYQEPDGTYRSPSEITYERHITIEVTEEEAKETGEGHACPICGSKSGLYICDGFPTYQGFNVFKEAS